MYGCAWMLISPHWQSDWNQFVMTCYIGTVINEINDGSKVCMSQYVQRLLQCSEWGTNLGHWWSNVAVWMQPAAYSCTDINFDSDVWMWLDIDITTLAISLKSICNDLLHRHSNKWDQWWIQGVYMSTCSTASAMILTRHNLRTLMIQCGGIIDLACSQ